MSGLILPASVAAKDWRYKVVTATRGNQTKLGTLFLAFIGMRPKNPPHFADHGEIHVAEDAPVYYHSKDGDRLEDGYVVTHFMDKNGGTKLNTAIAKVSELILGYRKIAEECKLSDSEQEALFSEFRKWIRRDWRAKPAPLS